MRILWLSLLVLVAGVGACDGDGAADARDARARWRRAAVVDYTFEYRTTGFAAPVDASITVRGGAVTNVDNLGDGLVLDVASAPTIEILFDDIERQLEGDADVDVTWDPTLGFPVSAYFDGGQEGAGFSVSSFQATP